MTAFVVLIPARLNSSRLPEKALADIAGKPMIVQVAIRAAKSQATRVVVATDSVDIVRACERFGVETVTTCTSHMSGTTRLAEAAKKLQMPPETVVVNVQGDEPLISPVLIDQVAARLVTSGANMATAAHAIADPAEIANPHCVKVVLSKAKLALYFSRAPIPFSLQGGKIETLRHVGIYAYRVDFLQTYAKWEASELEVIESLEQLRALWYGANIAVEVTDNDGAVGVDTAEDLARVRALFEARAGSLSV